MKKKKDKPRSWADVTYLQCKHSIPGHGSVMFGLNSPCVRILQGLVSSVQSKCYELRTHDPVVDRMPPLWLCQEASIGLVQVLQVSRRSVHFSGWSIVLPLALCVVGTFKTLPRAFQMEQTLKLLSACKMTTWHLPSGEGLQ